MRKKDALADPIDSINIGVNEINTVTTKKLPPMNDLTLIDDFSS